MRIAIDALGIHSFGGGRTATMNFLESLFTLDDKNEYSVFLSQAEPSLDIPKRNIRQVIFPYKNRVLLRLSAQLLFPFILRNFELIHFAKNLGVFGLKVPTVVTIYDVTTLIHPELFPKFDVWYWKTIEKKTLFNASKVIAISATTAHDLERIYSLPPERIAVIYPSVGPRFKPASAAEITRVRDKYHLPDKYILHVGRIDVKKKITLLVEAYALAKKDHVPGFPKSLVLVGEEYLKGQDETLKPTIERLGLAKEIIFTGGVSDDDLPAIMTGAFVSVSASVHEGFGLAPVEAMACGTPVIAYRAGALQEALGDAALLLDELNPESMAGALMKLAVEPDLRMELSRKGMIQAQYYQQERNTRKTIQLYEEIRHENQKRSTTQSK